MIGDGSSGISYSTIRRYIKQIRECEKENATSIVMYSHGNLNNKNAEKDFNNEIEKAITNMKLKDKEYFKDRDKNKFSVPFNHFLKIKTKINLKKKCALQHS
ncbi:hypothetical protein NPA07_03840 [Mycoplasmopsis caviae]|uniref:Uncharacterized protein n=1 Tax=Mycoplasmopsis caviae TaxID=55603 RepID=A0ABY5IYP8_9BACT|nr:hypothetical protein [Mycoplasmopsis caviae]UUD34916.1 hypothetical protein NPA07_03840 [Mycoplasmopsis caviae]